MQPQTSSIGRRVKFNSGNGDGVIICCRGTHNNKGEYLMGSVTAADAMSFNKPPEIARNYAKLLHGVVLASIIDMDAKVIN